MNIRTLTTEGMRNELLTRDAIHRYLYPSERDPDHRLPFGFATGVDTSCIPSWDPLRLLWRRLWWRKLWRRVLGR